MNTITPYRSSERAFRTYEPFIKRAVEGYPCVIEVTIPTLNGETVSARLRDAKKSLCKYKWTTTVDMGRFREVYNNLQVSNRVGVVLLGDKDSLKDYEGRELAPTISTIAIDFELSSFSEFANYQILTLAKLMSLKVIKQPLHLIPHPLCMLPLSELLSSLDLAYIDDPQGEGFTVLP